jgi:hypothetical protein
VLFAREGEAKGFAASPYDRDLISALTSVRAAPPPEDPGPPEDDLSAEAQYDSAPAQPVSPDLTGMDLIKRELGGRVIAEIDEP